MTLHETRRLRAILSELEKRFREEGAGGVFREGTADNDLHVQIANGSRNRWLADIICRELYPLLRICRFRTMMVTARDNGRAKAVHREHEAIIAAIEQRDPDAAERVMRAHLAASRTGLMAQLRRNELNPRAAKPAKKLPETTER
jgi:DNA-binding GntR family transcriptional regulator